MSLTRRGSETRRTVGGARARAPRRARAPPGPGRRLASGDGAAHVERASAQGAAMSDPLDRWLADEPEAEDEDEPDEWPAEEGPGSVTSWDLTPSSPARRSDHAGRRIGCGESPAAGPRSISAMSAHPARAATELDHERGEGLPAGRPDLEQHRIRVVATRRSSLGRTVGDGNGEARQGRPVPLVNQCAAGCESIPKRSGRTAQAGAARDQKE